MRNSLIAAAALLLIAACADAPITAADIQADGQLRQSSSQQSVHATSEPEPKAQRAEHLRVTGLLAGEADGPLEDATRFSVDNEAIYLHLRADDLSEPRPVTFVWTHEFEQAGESGEHRRETMGFLQPAETISLSASLPLARYTEAWTQAQAQIAQAQAAQAQAAQPEAEPLAQATEVVPVAGQWKVEVFSTDASGRSLVFERSFEVLEAETYEALMVEQLASLPASGADASAAGVSH